MLRRGIEDIGRRRPVTHSLTVNKQNESFSRAKKTL